MLLFYKKKSRKRADDNLVYGYMYSLKIHKTYIIYRFYLKYK